MKILGIDTTTKFLCLGAYDGVNIYEYNLELERKHSALLVPTIKRVLDALNWHIDDVEYFACGLGPGSFTGMRVGLSTIKGLSWSLNKPIVGISTLDILARGVAGAVTSIVPIIDAKRGLIYCSIYKAKKGILRRVSPYMLLAEDEFLKKIPSSATILGDAVSLYKENILRNIKGVKILDRDYWYPKARNIIELALERIREKRFSNAFNLEPIYLYPKECQIKPQITQIKRNRLHR